jgi:hypothetical protein
MQSDSAICVQSSEGLARTVQRIADDNEFSGTDEYGRQLHDDAPHLARSLAQAVTHAGQGNMSGGSSGQPYATVSSPPQVQFKSVSTAAELKATLAAGVPHIEIVEHLDFTNMQGNQVGDELQNLYVLVAPQELKTITVRFLLLQWSLGCEPDAHIPVAGHLPL